MVAAEGEEVLAGAGGDEVDERGLEGEGEEEEDRGPAEGFEEVAAAPTSTSSDLKKETLAAISVSTMSQRTVRMVTANFRKWPLLRETPSNLSSFF